MKCLLCTHDMHRKSDREKTIVRARNNCRRGFFSMRMPCAPSLGGLREGGGEWRAGPWEDVVGDGGEEGG